MTKKEILLRFLREKLSVDAIYTYVKIFVDLENNEIKINGEMIDEFDFEDLAKLVIKAIKRDQKMEIEEGIAFRKMLEREWES